MSYLAKKQISHHKIVVSGFANAGTTTVARSIAKGSPPPRITEYQFTLDYDRYEKQIGRVELHIFDLGGQTAFQENFIGVQAEFIFSGVHSFVWVIDSGMPTDYNSSFYYFSHSIDRLKRYSPEACIFILQHKIDLLPADKAENSDSLFDKFTFLMEESSPFEYFKTSIFSSSFPHAIQRIIEVSQNHN